MTAERNRIARLEEQLRQKEQEVDSVEARFAESNAHAAELVCALEEKNRQLEEAKDQLIQASKMSSLGVMVAGICHEINNPVAIIRGLAEVLQRENGSDPGTNRIVGQIREATSRVTETVNHLRNFTRDTSRDEHEPFDLLACIEEAIGFMQTHLSLEEITPHLRGEPVHVLGDRILMSGIFQNLLQNSQDAFAEKSDPGKKNIMIAVGVRDGQITVTYEDNAGGIPEEVLGKVFDPFFTTKEAGKGTGLGMSLAWRVVRDHQGEISVQSQPGQGARFTIQLPACPAPQEEPGAAGDPWADMEGESALIGGENEDASTTRPHVLVIDDEEGILTLLEAVLHKKYDLTLIQDARKALGIIPTRSFDLIITDLKMPFHSGVDVVRTVRQYDRKVPVLVISGHAGSDPDDDDLRRAMDAGASFFLPKPFPDIAGVLQKIRECLSAAA